MSTPPPACQALADDAGALPRSLHSDFPREKSSALGVKMLAEPARIMEPSQPNHGNLLVSSPALSPPDLRSLSLAHIHMYTLALGDVNEADTCGPGVAIWRSGTPLGCTGHARSLTLPYAHDDFDAATYNGPSSSSVFANEIYEHCLNPIPAFPPLFLPGVNITIVELTDEKRNGYVSEEWWAPEANGSPEFFTEVICGPAAPRARPPSQL
ncbi:hypothetical protein DFH09DRAFT_1099943 [Mycena vulgaris]|nr:hypothetical protein DFH09DRAFT_1099943 [Mycena vulgaris]